MLVENFEKQNNNEENIEKMRLLEKLPPELQKKHENKSIDEIRQIIEERQKVGYIPNPLEKLHITEDSQVINKEEYKKEIQNKLETGPEQP
jgi:hypothetical protein